MKSSLDKIRYKYNLRQKKFRVYLSFIAKEQEFIVQYNPLLGHYNSWYINGRVAADRNSDFPGWIYLSRQEDLYLPPWF